MAEAPLNFGQFLARSAGGSSQTHFISTANNNVRLSITHSQIKIIKKSQKGRRQLSKFCCSDRFNRQKVKEKVKVLPSVLLTLWPGNTKVGRFTVPLTSCLTGLESAV
jgi:hypothetical protein